MIENKLHMDAINYACLKLEKKPSKVLKRIKTILSTLYEMNSPCVLDDEN